MAEIPTLSVVSSSESATALARFAASVLAGDSAYISHGEIQGGRSSDGEHWSPDLERRLAVEFSSSLGDSDHDVIVAHAPTGDIVGFAQVVWRNEGAGEFGIVEDIAVARENRRSGIGRRLFEYLEGLAARRGAAWLWLESGISNASAHEFIESMGYAERSRIFGKRLPSVS